MPFTTYAELKTEIADWIVHDDVVSKAGDLITLFEKTADTGLRMFEREARQEHTVPTGETHTYVTLPDDWGGQRAVRRNCLPVEYLTPADMDWVKMEHPSMTTDSEFAGYYTIENGAVRFYPALAAGETVEFLYWQDIPVLSDTNTSNWLLAEYPHLYLYGSLMHAGAYIKSAHDMEIVQKMWETLTADLKQSDFRKKYGNGPLRIRPRGRR